MGMRKIPYVKRNSFSNVKSKKLHTTCRGNQEKKEGSNTKLTNWNIPQYKNNFTGILLSNMWVCISYGLMYAKTCQLDPSKTFLLSSSIGNNPSLAHNMALR